MRDPTRKLLLCALCGCIGLLAPRAARADDEPPLIQRKVPEPQPIEEGFRFGSYGRVLAGSDLEGGTGRQVQFIAHAPRLLAPSYAEADFGYTHLVRKDGVSFHSHLTLAFGEGLFHFNGDFKADVAIRNLYLEVGNVFVPGLFIWGGSRMYRGDDVYLLDFWPLDEQNTVGGGAAYYHGRWGVRLHAGVNRLDDWYQSQTVVVPSDTVGGRDVLFMDRERAVVTLRGERFFPLRDWLQAKLVLYGEAHYLGAGTRILDEQYHEEHLPSDNGFLGGFQVGLFQPGTYNHLNLFCRLATGLASFDELAIPFGLNQEKKAAGAREFLLALSSNYEVRGRVGLLTGFYTRYFIDADPSVYDRDDVWEVGLAVRPAWYVTDHFHLIGEANLQYQRPNGLSPETAHWDKPLLVELAFMPTLSLGRGSYSRPQLRLIFAATMLNQAARYTYAPEDPLRSRSVHYFFGAGTEWWFNSSYF